MADAVTMDKIVSLCRRRGFVFPSSEIYGGLGSTYDYGHYGVLMKNNIRQRWLEAMVQERDDIVLIDSAIILHPRVWEASGHVEGFTDPLVDCRTCKLRFREDQLGQRPVRARSRRSTRARLRLRPDRGAPVQPDVPDDRRRRSRRPASQAFLRPETAQGIFINFKNVAQLARRKPPFGIAQTGKSFRNEITPGNFLFRVREFEQMEMEFFVPPGRGGASGTATGSTRGSAGTCATGCALAPARARARPGGALALLAGDERHRVRLPDRLVGARGRRQPRRLRPDAGTPSSRARRSSGSAPRARSGTSRR